MLEAKYLLCRPRGGLNDTLSQIEKCWRYADSHDRILIVDTEYLISYGIGIAFDKIFKLKKHSENVLLKLDPLLRAELNLASVFPSPLKSRIDSYKIITMLIQKLASQLHSISQKIIMKLC